jgi:hypothetical protein
VVLPPLNRFSTSMKRNRNLYVTGLSLKIG